MDGWLSKITIRPLLVELLCAGDRIKGSRRNLDVDLTICWLISSRMEWIMYNGNAKVLAALAASDVLLVGARLLCSSSVASRAKADAKVILERE